MVVGESEWDSYVPLLFLCCMKCCFSIDLLGTVLSCVYQSRDSHACESDKLFGLVTAAFSFWYSRDVLVLVRGPNRFLSVLGFNF